MRVRGVAGDEDAAGAIPLRHRHAQVPEADVIELAGELEAGDTVEERDKVEICPGSCRWAPARGRTSPPADRYARRTANSPSRSEDAGPGRSIASGSHLSRPSLRLAQSEHGEQHDLLEIRALALDPGLFPHDRMAAVAADHIIPFEHRLRAVAGLVVDGDPHACLVLLDRLRRPAEMVPRPAAGPPSSGRRTFSSRYCGMRSFF